MKTSGSALGNRPVKTSVKTQLTNYLGVKRSADNTRPLGLKNTDNKIVAAVANRAITPTIAANADSSQNGFVTKRQGINNVVVLDTQARIQDHIAGTKNPIPTRPRSPRSGKRLS